MPKTHAIWCAANKYPVMVDAAIPETWLEKFMMPPTRPTLFLLAIKPGTDQPTGAAAESPPIEMLIQNKACVAVVGFGCTEDAESEHRAADQDALAHAARIVAMTNQRVDQPPANRQVAESRHQPRQARVEEGVIRIDM